MIIHIQQAFHNKLYIFIFLKDTLASALCLKYFSCRYFNQWKNKQKQKNTYNYNDNQILTSLHYFTILRC